MNSADILKLVDEISQTLVLTDPDAVEAFEALPEQFGDLTALLTELGHEEGAEASRACISISAKTLSGEADWGLGLDVLARTCDALQACVSEDCSAEEAGFPDELTEGMPPPTEQEVQERMEQETFEALRNEAMDRRLKSMSNEEFLAEIEREEEMLRQQMTGPYEGPPEVLFVGYVPFVGWIAEQLQESEETHGPLYGPGEEPSQETEEIRMKELYYEMRVLGQETPHDQGQKSRRLQNLGYSSGGSSRDNIRDFQREYQNRETQLLAHELTHVVQQRGAE